jgi:hypothetical protein
MADLARIHEWRCARCGGLLGRWAGDGFTLETVCRQPRPETGRKCGTVATLQVPRAGAAAVYGMISHSETHFTRNNGMLAGGERGDATRGPSA